MALFIRAKTTIEPTRPGRAAHLVVSGFNRRTRNPMYLGMAMAYVAVSLAGNALWPLLLLVPVLAVIRWYVIAREEAYLARQFGQPYLDYCARTPRWF